jgi:hypothetical protein
VPRIRRRAKARTGYTDAHIRQLLDGFSFGGDGFDRDTLHGACDREGMRAAWERRKPVILAMWIREYPCTRPYAWWEFDAPEPRKVTNGKPHPFTTRPAEGDRRLYYGCPQIISTVEEGQTEYETDAAYLGRIGELTDAERRAAKADPDLGGDCTAYAVPLDGLDRIYQWKAFVPRVVEACLSGGAQA